MTLMLTRCSRTPDSLSCNDRSHQQDYSTVPGLLFSEMLRFYGLKPEERGGNRFLLVVQPCLETIKGIKRNRFAAILGFFLTVKRKRTFGWGGAMCWIYADDTTGATGNVRVRPLERKRREDQESSEHSVINRWSGWSRSHNRRVKAATLPPFSPFPRSPPPDRP